jgi:hypothetical protein
MTFIVLHHKKNAMKKKLILAFILFAPFAVSAQSAIINSWSDPNMSNQNLTIHKMVVAALIYNQGVRRIVEDYVVSLYPGMVTQSYALMGDSLVTDEAGESQKLQSQGFDGILIMKQSGDNDQQQYIPGRAPVSYTTWGGYWGYWGGPHWVNHYNPGSPGHMQNNYTWFVQVNLYSLGTNTLIYSANTSTTRPGGTVPLFEDVSNAIRSQLSTDGIIQ